MNDNKQSWFKKHKILTVILAFVLLGIIVTVAGGGDTTNTASDGESTNSASGEKTYRFDDRADKQPKDVEVLPNEAATVDGVKMTLSNVVYKTTISEFEQADSSETYVIADVTLENTSNETKAYNIFDFRIQTSGGQVLDGAFATLDNSLSSGDMVSGGKASGQIVFEVPVEEGHQWVIWKPNAFNADRAIVQVK